MDGPAVGLEQRRGAVGAGVAKQHGLGAAEVQPGGRVLVGHPPAEAQDVGQRFLLGGVGPEAGAPQPRTERGVVQGDDGPHPGGPVVAQHDGLVAVLDHALEGHELTTLEPPGPGSGG